MDPSPGAVLSLQEPITGLPGGPFVLLALSPTTISLCLVGEDQDGDLCTTAEAYTLHRDFLLVFRDTGLTVSLR